MLPTLQFVSDLAEPMPHISKKVAHVADPLDHVVLSVPMLHAVTPAALIVNSLVEGEPPEPIKLVIVSKEVANVKRLV